MKKITILISLFLFFLLVLSFLIPFSSASDITYGWCGSSDTLGDISGRPILIESEYSLNVTGWLRNVSWQFNENMELMSLSGLTLWVNGNAVGSPDRWIHNCDSVGTHVDAEWINIWLYIDDSKVLFELISTVNGVGGDFATNTTDYDKDGDHGFYWSDSAHLSYRNGNYDGQWTGETKDMAIRFNLSSVSSQAWDDYLYVNPTVVYLHQPVYIAATVDTSGLSSWVSVFRGATLLNNYSIDGFYIEKFFYNTTVAGAYSVKLYRASILRDTKTFTVLTREYHHYVKFEPSPAFSSENVRIDAFLNYTNYDGLLECDALGISYYINSSQNEVHFYFIAGSSGDYVFNLYGLVDNSPVILLDSYIFHVKNALYVAPYVDVHVLDYNDAIPHLFRFDYGHPFSYAQAKIRVSFGSTVLYEGLVYEQEGSISWSDSYYNKGYHIVSLMLGNMVIATDSYYRSPTDAVTDDVLTPETLLIFIASLPLYVKIIVAIVIIVAITLIPMLVAVSLSKGNITIEIPSLVYVAFFFLGMITAVLLGFLDIWIFAIVLFGLILTFAILWVQKNRSE